MSFPPRIGYAEVQRKSGADKLHSGSSTEHLAIPESFWFRAAWGKFGMIQYVRLFLLQRAPES